jgi:hypothetical protein
MTLNVEQLHRLLPASFAVLTSPNLNAFVLPLSHYSSSLPISEFSPRHSLALSIVL